MYHFKIKVDPAVAWAIPESVREIKIEDMDVPVRNKQATTNAGPAPISTGKDASMASTDILVTIDHHASSAARSAVAVGSAKRHQARSTGLLVIRHDYPVEAAVTAARNMFEQQVAGAAIEGRWQCVDVS
ncbi:hypothetical protein OY671_013052, partial [Metschnikowia pulcherrima]